jgi:hypothetical protein
MIIQQNKRKTCLDAIFLLAIVLLFFLFVIFDWRDIPHKPSALLDNALVYWLIKGLSIVCCLFTLAGAIFFCKQLFVKAPLIEICDAYFLDNTSAISLGKIAWSDMEKVYVKGGFLTIKLKNPEAYFERMNWLQMLMIKANLKLGYGDVCISPQRFKKQAEEFVEEFKKRRPVDNV